MAIYDIDGNQLYTLYDIDGVELNRAYNIDGNLIFTRQPFSLKVMTYNVGQWYTGGGDNVPSDKDAAYYALQNGMIQNADAGILFINEYWKVFSKTGRTAKSMLEQYFPYIHEQGGDSGYFGRCLCSKYPISNYTTHSFSQGASQYYDTADVTINGETIELVLLHLITSPETTRQVQMQEVVSYLSTITGKFICAGDFNTGISPDRGTDNTESTQYTRYVKPLVDAGYNVANCDSFGYLVTCVDDDSVRWDIDNIVTSSDISIESVTVDTTKLTDQITDKVDHMPLIAELEVSV